MKSALLEDQTLVEGLQAGESRAAESLVDRYGGWVHRVVRRLLDDPRDVEEVTQDVLLTVIAVKSRVHRARLVLRQALAHLFSPARRPTGAKRPAAVLPAEAN